MFYEAPELPFALSHRMSLNLTEARPTNQRSPIHSKDLCGFMCIEEVMLLCHSGYSETSIEAHPY